MPPLIVFIDSTLPKSNPPSSSSKGEWLKYVPNVGLTYTLADAPRPSMSFSTGVLHQAKRERLESQRELLAIDEQRFRMEEGRYEWGRSAPATS